MSHETNPNNINSSKSTLDKPYIEESLTESERILNFLEEVRDGKVGGVWGDVDYKAPSEGYEVIQRKIESLKKFTPVVKRKGFERLNTDENQKTMLREAENSQGIQKKVIESNLLKMVAEGQANHPMDQSEKDLLEKAFRGGFKEEIELKRAQAQSKAYGVSQARPMVGRGGVPKSKKVEAPKPRGLSRVINSVRNWFNRF